MTIFIQYTNNIPTKLCGAPWKLASHKVGLTSMIHPWQLINNHCTDIFFVAELNQSSTTPL